MAVMLRVRAIGTGWTGAPGLLTTYWIPGTVGGSTADATDVVARVRACLFAARSSAMNTVVWNVDPTCDAIDAADGSLTGSYTGTLPASVVGSGTGELYAPGTALLVRAHTNGVIRGRKVQGRTFWGPTTEASVTAGAPDSGAVATVNGAWTGLLSAGSTASAVCVWSRPLRAVAPPHAIIAPGGAVLVTGYTVAGFMATIRSRRD